MMKCRRIMALLLALAGLCVLLPVGAGAAETLTERQRAVQETALSYYYRKEAVQYDSYVLTVQGKHSGDGAETRQNDFTSPEDATMDNIMYSVCSGFPYEVYYDAFGYKILGEPQEFTTSSAIAVEKDDPICVYKWLHAENKTHPLEDAIVEAHKLLQVGDIVVSSDHAMLYVGDAFGDGTNYVIHCFGKKYNPDKGIDVPERPGDYPSALGGALPRHDADEVVFGLAPVYTKGSHPLLYHSEEGFIILRPLAVMDESKYPLTDNARGRLQYNAISIDRRADLDRYRDAEPGQEVTITLHIENNSAKPYAGLPVTEVIPEGAALKTGSIVGGGTESDGKITWKLDIPKGGTATVGYTAIITGKRGDTVTFGGGSVSTIRSNVIPIRVGGKHLSTEQQAKLLNVLDHQGRIKGKGVAFAQSVYEQVLGLHIELTEIPQIMERAYNQETVDGSEEKMFVPKERESMAAMGKLVPEMIPYFQGGTHLKTYDHSHNRILSFEPYHFYPGDVIITTERPTVTNDGTKTCMVYLGDNKVVYLGNSKLVVADFEATMLKQLFLSRFFIGLRPTLVYDDVNTAKVEVKLPFTDVKEGDWYYEFVKELYEKGIVNGMTDTTFAPGGKLTYGQALKLIICGLGKGEQAATGSHWASGYLSYAKNQKWLDKDVDLNAAVSRLAFCQIAAKAKGLTAQPASNPFKDCADQDVLALVNAGIINGMSADTFAPDSILTRAQISKIICGMR